MRYERIDTKKIQSEVKITDFAMWVGLTLRPVGSYLTSREHDSLRIDPKSNRFYWNSMGKHGGVIEFVMTFNNMSFIEAVKFIEERAGVEYKDNSLDMSYEKPKEYEKEKKEFELPEKDRNMRKVFAYLIKTRGIDSEIVSDFVKRKQLYQNTKGSCVFVSYKDGKPVFASMRGTNTEHRFVGDVAGSDYSQCFYKKGNGTELMVFESVIDLMSYLTIVKDCEGDWKAIDCLALSGNFKFGEALKNHIKGGDFKRVVLCLDNDEGGRKGVEGIHKMLESEFKDRTFDVNVSFPTRGKDMNEELLVLKGMKQEREVAEDKEQAMEQEKEEVDDEYEEDEEMEW